MRNEQRNKAIAALAMMASALLAACGGGYGGNDPDDGDNGARLAGPSRSTSIALTADDRRLVVVNTQDDSVSVIAVRKADGSDSAEKLKEIAVGDEPRFVALSPDDREAYVANTAAGTVSVIALDSLQKVADIDVGVEPRGIAVTPNGTRLYVANHTAGTVTAVDLKTRKAIGSIAVGGNPMALAISNDGDGDDSDETVFVTQFFSELIAGRNQVDDQARRGVVRSFVVGQPQQLTTTTLAPLADSGFTARRAQFCAKTRSEPDPTQPTLKSEVFCPDTTIADANDPKLAKDPQGAFPNQLFAALIRGGKLFVPSVGAAPEPPTNFNINLQALVSVVDTASRTELAGVSPFNLNAQIKLEAQPAKADEKTSLARLFGNEIVALDASADGSDVLLLSRGGNYVLRARHDGSGRLDIQAPGAVQRFQTGNMPSGVVISADGKRAYTNNEVNVSVTAIALDGAGVLTRDIPSGAVPEPGSVEHKLLIGKLAFFTALGVPDNGFATTPVRAIEPLRFRNQASDNAWSSCASCHNEGLADGVTWSFGAGPRQTIPLDSHFAKAAPGSPQFLAHERISNWSAIRGSVTDFDINSRDEQGGGGFAGGVPFVDGVQVTAVDGVFNHGRTRGISESLDAMTAWVGVVRTYRQPQGDAGTLAAGRALFQTACASCHGGAKWSKSEIVYDNDPSFLKAPIAGDKAIDPRVANIAAQIVSFNLPNRDAPQDTLNFLDKVGSFDAASDFEINKTGTAALGAVGFNAPSLLGVAYNAPYFHDGSATTLAEVFARHTLALGPGPATIAQALGADLPKLDAFVRSIDATTAPLDSDTEAFKQRHPDVFP